MPEDLPLNTPTSLGSWVLLIAAAIDSYQLDSAQILKDAGLDLEELRKSNSRISAFSLYPVWYSAVEKSQDPYFGIRVAQHYQPNAFSALGMALVSSRNLHDALLRCARYGYVVSDATDPFVEESDDEISIFIKPKAGIEQLANIYSMSAIVCVLFKIMFTMSNGQVTPKAIYFIESIEQGTGPLEEFFGCPVYFNSEYNGAVFDKKSTQIELPFANSKLASSLDQWIDENLSEFKADLTSTRVQKYLLQNLTYGEINLQKVAQGLAMSSRVLQRRLKEEGTIFSELMDACRHKLAIKLITEKKQPIFEVALALGFSDQSNFTRAFKRWTGTTPHQYRV